MIALLLLACIPEGVPFEGLDYEPDTGWEPVGDTAAACIPDDQLAIARSELDFSTELRARYRASSQPADPAAWSYAGLGDTEVVSGNEPLDGHWFAGRFPTATHTAPLDAAGESWGVYREDATGLHLVGVASAQPDHTALVYSPAVTLWTWPLVVGQQRTVHADATGLFEGDAYPMSLGWGNEVHLTHSYRLHATGAGDVRVDAGTFEAQQVHIALEAVGTDDFGIEYGRATADTWLFIAPCAGMVARIGASGFMGLGL